MILPFLGSIGDISKPEEWVFADHSFYIFMLNPFMFIKKSRRITSSEGFFALEKNAVLCSQRAMLTILLGVTARCR
jgi:hypothetical protein